MKATIQDKPASANQRQMIFDSGGSSIPAVAATANPQAQAALTALTQAVNASPKVAK